MGGRWGGEGGKEGLGSRCLNGRAGRLGSGVVGGLGLRKAGRP